MTPTPTEVHPWPGAKSLGASIPDGWYMVGEAASRVGRSKDTLKQWRQDGTFEPSGYTVRGELTIFLYNEDDIEAMKIIAMHKKAGRPPTMREEETDDKGTG